MPTCKCLKYNSVTSYPTKWDTGCPIIHSVLWYTSKTQLWILVEQCVLVLHNEVPPLFRQIQTSVNHRHADVYLSNQTDTYSYPCNDDITEAKVPEMIAKVGIYISQLILKSHFLYRVTISLRHVVSLSLFLDTAQMLFPQLLTNTVLSLSTFLLLSSTAECQGVPCRGELAHFSLFSSSSIPHSGLHRGWRLSCSFCCHVLCLYPSLLFFCCNSLYPLWLHFSSAIFVFFLSFLLCPLSLTAPPPPLPFSLSLSHVRIHMHFLRELFLFIYLLIHTALNCTMSLREREKKAVNKKIPASLASI